MENVGVYLVKSQAEIIDGGRVDAPDAGGKKRANQFKIDLVHFSI